MSQGFSIIIGRGISATRHDREVVYGINATKKQFQLISTVQLPGAKGYDTQMVIHAGTRTSDVSLAREFKIPVSCGTQTWSNLSSQIQKRSSKRK